MLKIDHLTISHQKDLQTLIKDLSLIVNRGDKLAIIGEEGTGKSTLIKAIVSPEHLANYAILDGKIHNQFVNTAYLPQDLPTEDLEKTVSNFLFQDLDYNQFDFNLFYKMAELLQMSSQRLDSNQQLMRSLSGGEKIKCQLLKLLATDPDLLILDEPSSDLDLGSLKWLERFIHETDKTVIFISHDEALLEHTATAILHLELLKKRQEPRASYFQGDYNSYKTWRQVTFNKQMQVAQKEREEHAKKMARHHRIHQSVEHTVRNTHDATAGRLIAKKMKNVLSQEKRYAKEAENFHEIPQDMEAINLFFSHIKPLPVSKVLLRWEQHPLPTGQVIALEVRGQDKLVITGQNGIGKTRLLKELIAELDTKSELSVGYMPQHYEDLLDDRQSALQFLTAVSSEEKARMLLASLQFTREEITHSVSHLSGGQKAKLFLARMVLAGNNVLILDEPTRHFSPTSQPIIRQLLADFPGCIISVSHDRLFIKEVAKKSYELDHVTLKELAYTQ